MSENLKNLLEEKIAAYNRFAEDEAFDQMKFDGELFDREVEERRLLPGKGLS